MTGSSGQRIIFDFNKNQYSGSSCFQSTLRRNEQRVPNTNDSFRVDIHDRKKGVSINFQSATTNKTPMVMVTLRQCDDIALDRKVLPINIYAATMALGLFDLKKFCKKFLMPCLQVKWSKNNELKLHLNKPLVKDLIRQCNQRTSEDQTTFMSPSHEGSILHGGLQACSSHHLTSCYGETAVTAGLSHKTGTLPLLKQKQYMGGREYDLEADFNFDSRQICFSVSLGGSSAVLHKYV